MNKITYLLLGCFLIFTSCENALVQTLELDEHNFEKQLAISGALVSSNDRFRLLISENQAITDPITEWEPARDATATLFQGDIPIGDFINYSFNSYFFLDLDSIEVVPGFYRLEVEHPVLGKAVAQTEIPVDVKIEDIRYVKDYGIAPNFLTRSDAVVITIKDPPEDNYYRVKFDLEAVVYDTIILNNDTIINKSYPWINFDSNEPGVQGLNNGIIFSDEFFNGTDHTFAMYVKDFKEVIEIEDWKDDIQIIWEVLSKDKYELDRSLALYNETQIFDTFSETVSIYNNIEGGVGVFSGMHRTSYTIP